MLTDSPTARANPHGFIGTPTDHVYGIVDDPQTDVPQIISDLMARDVAADSIHVYCCQRGLQELSPSGKGYGPRARVQRILQTITVEGQHLRTIEHELNRGHALIGVAADDATQHRVANVMRNNGAHDIHFYGRFTIVDL